MTTGTRRAVAGGVMALAVTLGHGGPARANPEGGVVVGGAATIEQAGPDHLRITQGSAKAIIDWQSFDIDRHEHTEFRQPGADAIALNRVVGHDACEILGRLSADGQVWLVNPNGVFIGPDARIDVAGLIATTSDIRNDDFMAGRHVFHDDAGAARGMIENHGRITIADAGLAGLVAPAVANHGVIAARLGAVTLAAGRSFTVDLYGDRMINLALDDAVATRMRRRDGTPVDALVDNAGAVFADGGRVVMTAAAAKGVVDRVIDTSGLVRARTVEQRGGEIVLLGGDGGTTAVAGTLDAAGDDPGETGGAIAVSGGRTALLAGAAVDVSGPAGGGVARIGGDLGGGRPGGIALRPPAKPLPPAAVTVIDAGASVRADATDAGAGGTVAVWAEHSTQSLGRLSARGGPRGGDGGLIETSGLRSLTLGATSPDAAAPRGAPGLWWLDPVDVVIADAATAGGEFNDGRFDLDDDADVATIDAAAITRALEAGTAVTVTTSGDGDGAGDLTVAAGIVKAAGGDSALSLSATRDLILKQPIRATAGRLAVSLVGGVSGTVRLGAAVETNGGDLSVAGGAVVQEAAGRLSTRSGGGPDADSRLIIETEAISLGGAPGSITGAGVAELRPGRPETAITLGADAEGFALTRAELDTLSGFSSVTLGRGSADGPTGGGLRIAHAVTLPAATTLLGGTITIDGPLGGGDQQVTLATPADGTIRISADLGSPDRRPGLVRVVRTGDLIVGDGASIFAGSFGQEAGSGLTDLGAGTLDTTGAAEITTGRLRGRFAVGRLTFRADDTEITGSFGAGVINASPVGRHLVNGEEVAPGTEDGAPGDASQDPPVADGGGGETEVGGQAPPPDDADRAEAATDVNSAIRQADQVGADRPPQGPDRSRTADPDRPDDPLPDPDALPETRSDGPAPVVRDTPLAVEIVAQARSAGQGDGGDTGRAAGLQGRDQDHGGGQDQRTLAATDNQFAVPEKSAALADTIAKVADTMGQRSLHEALVEVSEPGGLTNAERAAVFAELSPAALIDGLARSEVPAAREVGVLLAETSQGVAVTQADIRQVLDRAGIGRALARAYLGVFERVRRAQRTQLFAGALADLRADPEAASIFTTLPAGALAAGTRRVADAGAARPPLPLTASGPDTDPPAFAEVRSVGLDRDGRAVIRGVIVDRTQFLDLRIDGRWVYVDETGGFEIALPVVAGANRIRLSARDQVGNLTEAEVTVEAAATTPPAAARGPVAAGRKRALLFANRDYLEPAIPDLVTPITDATAVGQVLRDRFGYEVEVVTDADKAGMVAALSRLGRSLAPDDQVVVYYAGHGYAYPETGAGYWLPADAEASSARRWVSNADVSRLVHRMPARQIILVADSCYSGSFTREREIAEGDVERDPASVRVRRSVMALSSGGDEPVMDGEVHSPFAAALISSLGGTGRLALGVELFREVHDQVIFESPQTPHYGAVPSAGYDRGGDYLWVGAAGGV